MIDLTAGGIFAAILGADAPEIREVLRDFDGDFCSYAPHRSNYHRDRYIEMLKEFTGFESVALFSAGTEAVEAFLRVSWAYTGKPGVWGGLVDPDDAIKFDSTRKECDQMHGVTLGSRILAGRLTWHTLGVFPELGGDYEGGRFGLGGERTGCMAMEPYHAPSAQFHHIEPTINKVMQHQRTWPDMLFLVDEIQGGFGRTGKLWAHEWYQAGGKFLLKPQFVTIGKLCGGGLPLSALLGPKEIMESDAVKEFGHLHSTHSGNPLMCAVGCRVIEEIRLQSLIERSRELGEILHRMLNQLVVRQHSGRGLLAGIEMADNSEVKRVVELCKERGVWVCDTGRKWVKIGPALNIELDDLVKGVKILMQAVEEVFYDRKVKACGDSGEGPEKGGEILQPSGVQPASGDTAGDMESEETKDPQAQ